jgi:hypothetical protein
MKKPVRLIGHVFWALGVSATIATAQDLPVFSMEAIPPAAAGSGGAVCGPKSRIVVSPGDAFVAQVFIRDWSGTGHQLAAYQIQMEPSGYSSGASGFVKPVNYNPEWNTQEDDPDNCFVDESHPQFIHKGMSNLALTDTVSNGYRLASILMRPENAPHSLQDGTKYYLGSINFGVTDDATGTFTIGFIENTNNTGLRDERGVAIDPAEFEPLTVVVKPHTERERPTFATLIDLLNQRGGVSDDDVALVDFDCDGALNSSDLLAMIARADGSVPGVSPAGP